MCFSFFFYTHTLTTTIYTHTYCNHQTTRITKNYLSIKDNDDADEEVVAKNKLKKITLTTHKFSKIKKTQDKIKISMETTARTT